MLILDTVTGSRLYGFNSNYDYYHVDTEKRNKQTIVGDHDDITVNLESFIDHVGKGVPQAMEALWSPMKWVHPDYIGFVAGLQPNAYELPKTYRRTIRSFVLEDTNKHRRHAMRLAYNLSEWWQKGVFNPMLPQDIVVDLTRYAESETFTVAFINDVSPVTVWDK